MSAMENQAPPKRMARDRLVTAAGALFYAEGYRGVGIDRVIADSGVAKATFYNHFPSKDDLIVAWIEQAATFGAAMEAEIAATSATPMSDVFDAYVDIALRPACMGCTFQGTAAEFPDKTHPAHAASLKVKNDVIARFEHHAAAQGVEDPRAVAEALFLLLEGVWAAVRMFGAQAPLGRAKAAARAILAMAGLKD
jgi:AcrR family transcriptional regulator